MSDFRLEEAVGISVRDILFDSLIPNAGEVLVDWVRAIEYRIR